MNVLHIDIEALLINASLKRYLMFAGHLFYLIFFNYVGSEFSILDSLPTNF